jgi:hypothetical protein
MKKLVLICIFVVFSFAEYKMTSAPNGAFLYDTEASRVFLCLNE